VIKLVSDGKFLIGGSGDFVDTLSSTTYNGRLFRLKPTGEIDNSFIYTATDMDVYDCVELSDKSVIFCGGSTAGTYVRKVDSAGVIDPSFAENTYDNQVLALAVQADGKILVGGAFEAVNGNPQNYLVRLHTDGTVDTNFSSTIGSGPDGTVRGITVMLDGTIFLVGNFLFFNGNSVGRIVKLGSTGAFNTSFNAAIGTGFDAQTNKVIPYSTGKILVAGGFSTFDGATQSGLIKLNTTGTADGSWTGVIFSAPVTTAVVREDGSIITGGEFNAVNGNPQSYCIELTSNGGIPETVLPFGFDDAVRSLAVQTINGYSSLAAVGAWTGYTLPDTTVVSEPYIISIALENSPMANYDPRGIHTSEEEVIVMRALSSNRFEPWGYSETHEGDIVQFMPFCNTIGVMLDNGISNGETLPDSTIVNGFDPQWDSENGYAYVDMPENYPALFGYLLYLSFQTGSDYYEMMVEPLVPGENYNQENVGGNNKTFNISTEDGQRIILLGITEGMIQAYVADSMYADSAYSIAPAYGWMTRRVDTHRNIDLPMDWRNIRYRRWHYSNFAGGSPYIIPWDNGVSFYDPFQAAGVVSTGNYKDTPVIKNGGAYQFRVNGRGGTIGYWWWMGNVEQVVFMADSGGDESYAVDLDVDWFYKCTFNSVGSVFFKGNSITRTLFGSSIYYWNCTGRVEYTVLWSNSQFLSGMMNLNNFKAQQIYAIDFSSNYLWAYNLGGDFSSTPNISSTFSKTILKGSDDTWYLQYYDGITVQYQSIP
jgi:uncharacterized delta-60 repeat protein